MVKDPSPHRAKSRVDHAAEAQALTAARQGQLHDAVKILMRAYGDLVTAFARRIVGHSELAGDVRQQVFLDAFQGLDRFKGQSSLWTWLCGIAYHRSIDELRRNRRAGAEEDLDVLDGLIAETDPALDPEQIARRRALERCLAKLPVALRSQLLMRYFLGLSHQEIAETIGEAHTTVQVRISRILPRLKRCMQREGVAR